MEDVRLWASDQEDPIQALVAQFPEFFQDGNETSDDGPALIEGRRGNGIDDNAMEKMMLKWVIARDTLTGKSERVSGLIQATEFAFSVRVLTHEPISDDIEIDLRFEGIAGQFYWWRKPLFAIIGSSGTAAKATVANIIDKFDALQSAYVRYVKWVLDARSDVQSLNVASERDHMKGHEIKDVAEALMRIFPAKSRKLRTPGKGLKRTRDLVAIDIADRLGWVMSCLITTTHDVIEEWKLLGGPISSKISAGAVAMYDRIRGRKPIGDRVEPVGGFIKKLTRKQNAFVTKVHGDYLECAEQAASFGAWMDELFAANRKKGWKKLLTAGEELPPAEEYDANDSIGQQGSENGVFDIL